MFLRFFTVITLVLLSSSVFAISNIESQRPGPPPEGWSGNVELSASGKSGDVDEDRYSAGGRLAFKANNNLLFAMLNGQQTSSRNVKTADEFFAHARWVHQYSPRVATEGFLQFQENEFANLLSRYLAGGGGRFELFEKPDTYSFSLGLGAFHEWERTDLGDFTESERDWRANSYISYRHQLNEQVSWFNTLYYQPAFDDTRDYRMLWDTGLMVRLTGALHLRISYNWRRNSNPPQNLEVDPIIDRARTNIQYVTAFRYEF